MLLWETHHESYGLQDWDGEGCECRYEADEWDAKPSDADLCIASIFKGRNSCIHSKLIRNLFLRWFSPLYCLNNFRVIFREKVVPEGISRIWIQWGLPLSRGNVRADISSGTRVGNLQVFPFSVDIWVKICRYHCGIEIKLGCLWVLAACNVFRINIADILLSITYDCLGD